jgi:hypothetical protein
MSIGFWWKNWKEEGERRPRRWDDNIKIDLIE